MHTDHLGSPRVVVDDAGNYTSSHHYMPFGDEKPLVGRLTSNNMKFTGHERDVASASFDFPHELDYMLARYYSSSLGRFMAADPANDIEFGDPQSWNLFAYTRNNPIGFVDPTGTITMSAACWAGLCGRNKSIFGPSNVGAEPGEDGASDPIGERRSEMAAETEIGRQYMEWHFHPPKQCADGSCWVDRDGDVHPINSIVAPIWAGGPRSAGGIALTGRIALSSGLAKALVRFAPKGVLAEALAGGGKAIIGAGTTKTLGVAGELAAQHGGRAGEWAKMTTHAETVLGGRIQFSIHYYKNTASGLAVELKAALDWAK